MSNEVLSVEGQLVGIPLQEYTAGQGIVVDSVNKVIKVDETVLWEGETLITTGSVFELSETPKNFNTIKIYASRNPSVNAPVVNEFYTQLGSTIGFIAVYGYLIVDSFQGTLSDASLSIDGITRKQFSNTTFTSASNAPLTMVKVVGVNRIAGGNT